MTPLEYWKARCEKAEAILLINDYIPSNDLLEKWFELYNTPEPEDECEHPWGSILGDGEMQPAKCLKCGKIL